MEKETIPNSKNFIGEVKLLNLSSQLVQVKWPKERLVIQTSAKDILENHETQERLT